MRLIIGLGNPGLKYKSTRHNIGFLVIDKLASDCDISVSMKGFDAFYGRGNIGSTPVLLAKPQTYMNISGISVKKLIDYFKIDLEGLIIIHDDIDLPFETIRLKMGGGHAGHKGLISIIDQLEDMEFIRVRIGIGKPADRSMVEKYVLEPFTEDEMKLLSRITASASDAVTMIISSGIQAAMNHYNEKITNPSNKKDDVLPC
ncbi:MAG TPA: aminoacyl-tRNA hydrolase [Syntrophales bacterium]|nr:aminoacyl-tRNA hydrolase [Syntrophales bacterium]